MSGAARTTFPQAERYDPTLAVDGLHEFLPPLSESGIDPTLAVSALHDFFTEEETADARIDDVPLPEEFDMGLETGAISDYFSSSDHTRSAASDDDQEVADQQADVDRVSEAEDVDAGATDVATEGLAFQTEIQRAAVEFQRFAEQFHAFASQCQHRRAF